MTRLLHGLDTLPFLVQIPRPYIRRHPIRTRPARRSTRPAVLPRAAAAFSTSRCTQATHHDFKNPSTPIRKNVTLFNDDGRTKWNHLTLGEKGARATRSTFDYALVLLGVVAVGYVAMLLFEDVLSPDSKTAHFNNAADRVKRDPRCQELLGDAKKITASGEPSHSRWARNRYIVSTTRTDKIGTHQQFHFYVSGPLNHGVVHVHMIKQNGETEYEYQTLALDVEGHQRIYLENRAAEIKGKGSGPKIFGVRWW